MRARVKAAVGVRSSAGRVRRPRLGLLVVALVVTSVAVLAAPALAGAATTLSVDAAAGPPSFNATGVTIPAGEYVTVTATGTWSVASGNPSRTSDANGVPGLTSSGFVDPSAPAGTLIGSLDGGSTWFAVGAGPTKVTGPGTLILSDNDYPTNFGDNTGSLSVTITDPVGPQSVTFLGADPAGGASINNGAPNYTVQQTVQDALVQWDDNGTWKAAYDVGVHPWGQVAGTNSWIACQPWFDSCTGTDATHVTTTYRLRFNVPSDWTNPTMTLTMRADNEASVTLNGQTIISDYVGSPTAESASVTPPLQAGVNELDFMITDWGGIAGFNYSAVLNFDASAPPTVLTGCLPGTYSDTGAQPCTDAPAGTYVATGWATSATPCAAGSYSADSGAVACDQAPVDTYVSAQGATAATPCPDGTTTNGLTGQTACVPIPPTITLQSIDPAANAAGWNNGPVTVTWSCTNSQTATVTAVLSSDGANQSATGTCIGAIDSSLTASDTQTGISIDQTAPTLAPSVSPDPVALNGSATASPNASDSGSGLASASCDPVDTSAYGDFTVSCSATDKAGNTATATASYEVAVQATKQQVLSEIQAAIGSGHRDGQEALRVAAGALQRAVQSRLWTDGNHPTNRLVFADEQLATDALSAYEHQRHTSVSDGTVQGWISSLVTADQGLASIAIADATAGGGNSRTLALASRELGAGNAEASHGRANAAIAHYATAWQLATQSGAKDVRHHGGDGKSVDHGPNNGGGGNHSKGGDR